MYGIHLSGRGHFAETLAASECVRVRSASRSDPSVFQRRSAHRKEYGSQLTSRSSIFRRATRVPTAEETSYGKSVRK